MPSGEVTGLLRKWSQGNQHAGDELASVAYTELRHLARRYLQHERDGHSLRSVDLVHEAYLRLVDQQQAEWRDRAHFFAVCGKIMRQILVDHARAHLAEKRGGGAAMLVLNEAIDLPDQRTFELIALDDALESLAKLDPRQSQIVELRFFAGLSLEETAEALHVSRATVNRSWVTARAWLLRELSRR
jgi:RNA polymerase sigma factor (TIGR02999 family)